MLQHTKPWAIAALVGLAAPSLLLLHPDAARAQSVCGRSAQVESFETSSQRIAICDEGRQLSMILINKRSNTSRWLRVTQNGSQSYRGYDGPMEYQVDRSRLTIYDNGWEMMSEPVIARTDFLGTGSRLQDRYDNGYRDGYNEGWNQGRADRGFSYDPDRALGPVRSDEYGRGYQAGFRQGYDDSYRDRR